MAAGLDRRMRSKSPFVFGNLEANGVELYTGSGSDRMALSNRVQDAWISLHDREIRVTPSYRIGRLTTRLPGLR